MKQLFLENLKDFSDEQVKNHLKNEYSNNPIEVDKYKILIAYESVGDYGCDSSSYFLLRDKKSKILFEVFGSHCSCYGFEGQFTPEPTELKALKARIDKSNLFYTGGYDNSPSKNQESAKEFIKKMKK